MLTWESGSVIILLAPRETEATKTGNGWEWHETESETTKKKDAPIGRKESQKVPPSTGRKPKGKEIICECKRKRSSRESEPDGKKKPGKRRDDTGAKAKEKVPDGG